MGWAPLPRDLPLLPLARFQFHLLVARIAAGHWVKLSLLALWPAAPLQKKYFFSKNIRGD